LDLLCAAKPLGWSAKLLIMTCQCRLAYNIKDLREAAEGHREPEEVKKTTEFEEWIGLLKNPMS